MNKEESNRQRSIRILENYAKGVPLKELRVDCSTLYRLLHANGIKPNRRSHQSRDTYRTVSAPGHPGANSSGRIREHILIATKALGRPLKKGEVVHHINGNKHDNRNSNLLICTQSYHQWLHWEMAHRYQREHFT